jgi:hypothetical protein
VSSKDQPAGAKPPTFNSPKRGTLPLLLAALALLAQSCAGLQPRAAPDGVAAATATHAATPRE